MKRLNALIVFFLVFPLGCFVLIRNKQFDLCQTINLHHVTFSMRFINMLLPPFHAHSIAARTDLKRRSPFYASSVILIPIFVSILPTGNELRDHLLRDKKCERIDPGRHCGTGTLSYTALATQQSKVNGKRIRARVQYQRQKKLLVGTSVHEWLCNCVWDKQRAKWWSVTAPLPTVAQTEIAITCRAVGGRQKNILFKSRTESAA